MPNLFEIAARKSFRYPSAVGQLTTEQLFGLPLTSQRAASLDDTARKVNIELKAAGEESFVSTANPAATDLAAKLEIIKFVIASKQDEVAKAQARVAKRAERERLLAAFDAADQRELGAMSKDDLAKRLAALDDE